MLEIIHSTTHLLKGIPEAPQNNDQPQQRSPRAGADRRTPPAQSMAPTLTVSHCSRQLLVLVHTPDVTSTLHYKTGLCTIHYTKKLHH